MSDLYKLQLATGEIVVGAIHGSGGTIPAGQFKRVLTLITRANEGDRLSVYEPEPGCVSIHVDGGRRVVSLRGANLLCDVQS